VAQTFIGNLILRLQENVSAGAQKAAGALKGVDRAAAGIGRNASGATNLKRALDGLAASTGKLSAPWGANLQQQLQRLGASASEIDKVRSSWDQLQARLTTNGIGGRLRSNEIAAWRLAVAGNLTAVRSEADRTRQSLIGLGDQVRRLAAMGGLMAGGVGGALLGRAGIQASASYEDLKIRLEQMGWDPKTNQAIIAEANKLAARYGQSRSNALEALIEGAIGSDKPQDVLKKSDTIGRALVMETLYSGPGRAVEGFRNLDKARDQLGIEDPEEMRKFADGYYRAKSVLGADLTTDQYRQAVQYARTAGKVVDMEYLSTTLPSMIAESKGSDAGSQLRALFDQMIVGRASKQAQEKQREYGLRDENGVVTGEALFKNPAAFVNDVVAKKLEERGILKRDAEGRVDKEGRIALAREIGQLTNNRLSSDQMYRLIDQGEIYERQKRQMRQSKGGLDGADKVLAQSPTMSWQALQSSLQNVASTVGETVMPVIVPGLNSISGGLNSLATSLQAMDAGTVAKLGAAGLGLYGIMKVLGPVALAKRVADAAGATGVPGEAGKGPAGPSRMSRIMEAIRSGASRVPAGIGGLLKNGLVGGAVYGAGSWGIDKILGVDPSKLPDTSIGAILQRLGKDAASVMPWNGTNPATAPAGTYGGWTVQEHLRQNNEKLKAGSVDTSALDQAQAKAAETQAKMDGLNTTVKPGVDTSALLEVNALLDAALAKLGQLGNAASAASARVGASVGRELRAAQSDFGVSP
jgi:hypothetical protein